jgi:transcriptional regulator with XRE-family HTH domain
VLGVVVSFFRCVAYCANLHSGKWKRTTFGVHGQVIFGASPKIHRGGVFVQYGFIERLREVVSHVGGQKELERLSGVDQTTISAWLKRAKNPKFQTVQKIADATGFCAEWLYLGTGPKHSQDEPSSPASLDLELLVQIVEHVESALALRGRQYQISSHDKARVVVAAYDFYRQSGAAEIRRGKILEFLRRITS